MPSTKPAPTKVTASPIASRCWRCDRKASRPYSRTTIISPKKDLPNCFDGGTQPFHPHPVLALDQAAAELAGRIQGELERVGQPIGRADPIIAATALQNGLELVTGNTAHYQRIQQIGHPLVLVNWRI